jgi:hypothetical protein
MIQDKIDLIEQSHQIFVVGGQQFPTFLTENVSAIQPPGPSWNASWAANTSIYNYSLASIMNFYDAAPWATVVFSGLHG